LGVEEMDHLLMSRTSSSSIIRRGMIGRGGMIRRAVPVYIPVF
jgi:hypothetical protein